MDPLAQMAELVPLLVGLAAGIGAADLERPTACEAFDVAGVLGHMVAAATMFGAAYRGEPAPPGVPPDVLAEFGPAMAQLHAAMAAPGALAASIAGPFGEVDGATFARFVVLDGLVHGWDLATATGQNYEPSSELVAQADAFARGAIEALRGDAFGPEVAAAPGVSPIERLAAFTGRHIAA